MVANNSENQVDLTQGSSEPGIEMERKPPKFPEIINNISAYEPLDTIMSSEGIEVLKIVETKFQITCFGSTMTFLKTLE